MKTQNITKKIFRLFWGKHFSIHGKSLFGIWLCAEKDKAEKEHLLYQYWMKSEGKLSDETRRDWNRLHSLLETSSDSHKKVNRLWVKYAAAITIILTMTGTTYWITKHVTLQKAQEIKELFVPYGETCEILLADGSSMWVNAGSTVLYPVDFKYSDSRTIYLTGEASFHVAENKKKPFIVKTSNLNVQALGTVFTVKAYPDDKYVTATLEQGSIKVMPNNEKNDSYTLKTGEQLIYSHKNRTIRLNKIDVNTCKKQRNGYLIFEKKSFPQIVSTLEKRYDVTVQYNASHFENDLYNVKFAPDETIEDVMNILGQLIDAKYKIEGKNILVK